MRRKASGPELSVHGVQEGRDGGVQSVGRALSILETLAEDDCGYRLSDLAVQTGLSNSTVHRLLLTLESRRFVHFDQCRSTWHIGVRSFAVGATFARRRNVVAYSVPYLRKLRDLTRETANLAVVDDEFIVILGRLDSREIMRSLAGVGGRAAMAASGVGKALLANYSDEDVGGIIRRRGMPRLTERTIARPSELFRELETIRQRGYAVDNEEACTGLRCVAAVIYTGSCEPLAAISVSGLSSRLTDGRLPELGQTVCGVAAELTVALNGVVPARSAR